MKRGTEALIRPELEDNKRQRRVSEEEEELRLLQAAPPMLRSMIITALDTGTRRGEPVRDLRGDDHLANDPAKQPSEIT